MSTGRIKVDRRIWLFILSFPRRREFPIHNPEFCFRISLSPSYGRGIEPFEVFQNNIGKGGRLSQSLPNHVSKIEDGWNGILGGKKDVDSGSCLIQASGGPNGNRTRVFGVRGRRPRPLDDGTFLRFEIWSSRLTAGPGLEPR